MNIKREQKEILTTHPHMERIEGFAEMQAHSGANNDDNYRKQMKNMGILLVIAIALHDFPEGIVIGAARTVDKTVAMALLIGIHNIPEGIAIAAPMFAAGVNKLKVLLLVALSGLPSVFGAVLGYFIGGLSPVYVSIGIGTAAGAMLYVVFHEMLPKADEVYRNKYSSLIVIFSMLTGFVLVKLL